jgi:hypothetical protein
MQIDPQSGDGAPRLSPEERTLSALRAFPKPIAVACAPWPSTGIAIAFEGENGYPYSIALSYVGADGEKLLVRTKTARPSSQIPVSPITTIDTLQTSFGIYGRRSIAEQVHQRWLEGRPRLSHQELVSASADAKIEFDAAPRRSMLILADGAPVSGTRVDFPDCSGIELGWSGQTVHCIGTAAALDGLELRSGSEEELARRPAAS